MQSVWKFEEDARYPKFRPHPPPRLLYHKMTFKYPESIRVKPKSAIFKLLNCSFTKKRLKYFFLLVHIPEWMSKICSQGTVASTMLNEKHKNGYSSCTWGGNSRTGYCVGLAIALLCGNHYVACFEPRLVPLSKVLFRSCFICGQRCKCWFRQPKLTSLVISDVKPIIYIYIYFSSSFATAGAKHLLR